MDIFNITLSKIKPYPGNPRLNNGAVSAVAESISQFGFRVPIVLDKDNFIICGHTRYKAAKKLKMKTVPCVMADDLTDEQVRAYRLADNKVAEAAEWDDAALSSELSQIFDIDMSAFGFDVDLDLPAGVDQDQDDVETFNDVETQIRKENIDNLAIAQFKGCGQYDIPQIAPVKELPDVSEWIGFNYVMSDSDPTNKGVHFFVDDYQFNRVWNDPERYIEKLSKYKAVLSPDFSPYGDMPNALQIFNHYKKHWCAAYWQTAGITVIPTIRCSTDERSLEWYLDGEPKGGVVAYSSMWVKKKDKEMYAMAEKEFKTMAERLNPSLVVVYGKIHPFMDGVKTVQIDTFAERRFKNNA